MTASPRARAGRGLAHEVRIIGGTWKRTRLAVPDRPGLRPTPSRVRETLFNWLGQDLSGWRCLDAFAGSGALGLEAASRGAAEVVLLERDAALVQILGATVRRLAATQVKVERADALAWMARAPRGGFDLVLLDPPFDAAIFDAALAAGAPLARPGGWVYLEADREWPGPDLAALNLQCVRHLRAGAVHAHLLQAAGEG
ncbi:MAG TPA: 16S rRNA (guanine(966)-N(2))-methyltransferase RsmD [Burkholderiaceae bacterium]|nr:16S rRNA (guanine(966)-N(2))-methyltransferase RsmD [Burkholderiaceae bacterium]